MAGDLALAVVSRSIGELHPIAAMVGPDAIGLTDYHGDTISRLPLQDAVSHCRQRPQG